MHKIEVFKAFILNLSGAVQHKFEVGVHEVEAAVASHWYTLAHATVVAVEDEAEKLRLELEAEATALAASVAAEIEKLAAEAEAVVEPAVEPVVEPITEAVTEVTDTVEAEVAPATPKSKKK